MNPIHVGILGATGTVGRELLRRLADHPWFRITAIAGSERRSGQQFDSRTLCSPRPEEFDSCEMIFSALDRTAGERLEPLFAEAGKTVISNSAALRMHSKVPLLIPEINPDSLQLLKEQPWSGSVVANPNCSVMGLALALAPLHEAVGIEAVVVSTLQALSGAGSSGPTALSMIDNVVPLIPGEEEKIESELGKILGAEIPVSAHCHRVPVIDGHMESVSLRLARSIGVAEAAGILEAWKGSAAGDSLPSAPDSPLIMARHPDRPQTRLDRDAGAGMSVTIGRLRSCPVFDLRFTLLSHNLIRGAAGAALLNAELMFARGLIVSGAHS